MALQTYRVNPASVGGFNAMIYGSPGVGKTYLAAGAQDVPELSDTLFLDVEGGLRTVAERDDIRAATISTVDELEEAFFSIKGAKAGFEGIKTVVVDSISELYKRDSDMRKTQHRDQRKAYGESGDKISQAVRRYKEYPGLNVILLSQQKERFADDDSGTLTEVGPAMGPALATSIMASMDYVWYMYVRLKDQQRVLLTAPKGVYRAKTRGVKFAEALGGAVEAPTLPEIYKLFTGTGA